MRIPAGEFWQMDPREFWNALEGWSEHQKFLQQEEWERMRMQTWLLYSIQLKPEDRRGIKEFMPFAWDKDQNKEVKLITPEELEKLTKLYGNKSGS